MKIITMFCFLNISLLSHSQTVDKVINKVFVKIDSINTLQCFITARERNFNKYNIDKGFYKISEKPFLIYFKQLVPPTGAEVLINSETLPNALVNPHKSLIPNLTLNPYGEVLRDSKHHNIYQSGFKYFKEILLFLKKKYNLSWNEVSSLDESAFVNSNPCYKIVMKNNNFKIINYTVNQETTPQELALKLNICDYHILELNPEIKNLFTKLKPGKVIKIPSDYASIIVLYIDKINMLPLKIEVYDNKGLFEDYLFENIVINRKFKDEEFKKTYKDYSY